MDLVEQWRPVVGFEVRREYTEHGPSSPITLTCPPGLRLVKISGAWTAVADSDGLKPWLDYNERRAGR